jgi:hypothetical protein
MKRVENYGVGYPSTDFPVRELVTIILSVVIIATAIGGFLYATL